MSSTGYAKRFNTLSLRERGMIALVVLVLTGFAWWYLYAEKTLQLTEQQIADNQRLATEVNTTLATIKSIRDRITAGVHKEKQVKFVQLQDQLEDLQESLRLKTEELIDPEDMFELMSQMVYRDSRLKLLSLKRREVKPAIVPEEGQKAEVGIYRHVLEVKFSGQYTDILKYMQSLEAVDWKLIWDEIEIVRGDYPQITIKLVISTLSTREEWVGV